MDDRREEVILVGADDEERGKAPKLEAHRAGLRHRALSVILRDPPGRLLLQKRARGKYHSGGLWTNTCCSHPRPGEAVLAAARRRLFEELGIRCRLVPLLVTSYRADVGSGMIEDEIVHVFAGIFEGPIRPDPAEVEGFSWLTPEEVRAEVERAPERYSVWFRKYVGEHWDSLVRDPCWRRLAA